MSDRTRSVNRRRDGGGYVKLHRSIWQDPDFTALPPMAQRLYLLLISQPDISTAGVVPLTAGRWSTLAAGMNANDVRADLDRLCTNGFIAMDECTEEVWVRSYIAYDQTYTSPNGLKSLQAAARKVVSPFIRERVEGAIEGVASGDTEGAYEGDTSPQQPAAISHEPETSSREPEPPIGSPLLFLSDMQQNAAAAAYERWIGIRLNEPDVQKPRALEAHLRSEAVAEWHGKIHAHFMNNPDATAEDLLYEVFRINPTTGQRRAS